MSIAALPSLTPVLATAGIGWLYYRRIRRQFGRQPWKTGARTWLRIALLSLVLVALLVASAAVAGGAVAVAAGLAAGAVLGALSLMHTHVEHVDGARWYTPNPWIGGALSLLLVGRLAWRWQQGFGGAGAMGAQQASPLTLAFAAALIAFYLSNTVGLAWRMRQMT
jgi:hypothetical protein